MILVDTSVWVDHFRSKSNDLSALLENNRVLIHPLVIGELACGNLQNRIQILKLFKSLIFSPSISHDETFYFIEKNKLMGKGVGYIDIQLLASTSLEPGARIWTKDKRLKGLAANLGLAWNEII